MSAGVSDDGRTIERYFVVHLDDTKDGYVMHSFPDGRFCPHCVGRRRPMKFGAGC